MVAKPIFNKPHGLYTLSFALTIKGENEGLEIRYTTDGSEPTASSLLYKGSFIISKTHVIRAAEFINGEMISDVTSASYIFPNMVVSQTNTPEGYPAEWGNYCSISGTAPADYEMDPDLIFGYKLRNTVVNGLYALPVLSITTDRGNLFNKEKDEKTGGIYIYTGCPVGDGTGRGWERPASVELFGGAQEYDLSVDCALKLHGGHSRLPEKNPKS